MYILKWFRFIIAKIYNILRYVICSYCNLHIKETEISQKRSKGIKNWKITYSVILSVLSNKKNLILGFSPPLSISTVQQTLLFTPISVIPTSALGFIIVLNVNVNASVAASEGPNFYFSSFRTPIPVVRLAISCWWFFPLFEQNPDLLSVGKSSFSAAGRVFEDFFGRKQEKNGTLMALSLSRVWKIA